MTVPRPVLEQQYQLWRYLGRCWSSSISCGGTLVSVGAAVLVVAVPWSVLEQQYQLWRYPSLCWSSSISCGGTLVGVGAAVSAVAVPRPVLEQDTRPPRVRVFDLYLRPPAPAPQWWRLSPPVPVQRRPPARPTADDRFGCRRGQSGARAVPRGGVFWKRHHVERPGRVVPGLRELSL